MAVNWKILAQFVKIPPQAWDYIIPKGPIHGSFTPRLAEHVALNPQPLPPHEAVIGARLLENVLSSAIIIEGGKGGGEAGRALQGDRGNDSRIGADAHKARVAQRQVARDADDHVLSAPHLAQRKRLAEGISGGP